MNGKLKSDQIILIANVNSTFVLKDEQYLSEFSKVKKLICSQPKTVLRFILEQVRIVVFTIKHIRSSKAVFCWFSDYHSYFPAVISGWYNKPFYLIQGGYDTTYLPELDYGVFTNWLRTYMVNYAYCHATLNLPVSQFLAKEILHRYKKMVPVEVLPTGYSIESSPRFPKEQTVLTVAGVETPKRLLIKGVDRFIALAKEMPDYLFIIIGVKKTLLKAFRLPDNLTYQETIPKSAVNDYFNKAKVYCQFSLREGLPNAVFEAMLYQCVVVGMNHSGVAEAIGDAGYLLDEWTIDGAKRMVEMAMVDLNKGIEGQNRVRRCFNEASRSKRLRELVDA